MQLILKQNTTLSVYAKVREVITDFWSLNERPNTNLASRLLKLVNKISSIFFIANNIAETIDLKEN